MVDQSRTVNPARAGVWQRAGCAFIALGCAAAASSGATLVTNVNITGIASFDAKGAAINSVLSVSFPPATTITGIGWNVTQTAHAPSWISEMAIQFKDSTGAQSFSLLPGAGTNTSGQASFSSGGVVSLSSLGIPNLLLANGVLSLEFYETFDDAAGVADGVWSGTVFTNEKATSELLISYVPTPSGVIVLGATAIGAARRRRLGS